MKADAKANITIARSMAARREGRWMNIDMVAMMRITAFFYDFDGRPISLCFRQTHTRAIRDRGMSQRDSVVQHSPYDRTAAIV